ncbi:conserved hypothetical protein [Roseateles sp. YR242]|uniref:peptidoglycan editing factor PgeF n=1 Tax=Roseateles sp. YR242 TaxID=1855305 RepID=UPI0008C410C1|nr:peptidoglycan editing factor PgeF [Roseateles sp. YR242]SEK99134.1 conserved hypothetical protein [Roseateles sp. YR242]
MELHDWLRPDWTAPQAHAFMTTRAGGVSKDGFHSLNLGRSVGDTPSAVAENRRRVAAAIGATPVFLKQVHGNKVLTLEPAYATPGADPEPADASISLDPTLACAVMVADCLPVLFATARGVGAAHAGWRGLSSGVLENTVQVLCETTGCDPDQIQAWMGASIGPQAFEVGADVLQAFGVEPQPRDQPLFRFQPNTAGEPRWRADLYGLARQRLTQAGLRQVYGGGWCTFSEPSRFFSYRHEQVDGRPGGRMAAVIRLR